LLARAQHSQGASTAVGSGASFNEFGASSSKRTMKQRQSHSGAQLFQARPASLEGGWGKHSILILPAATVGPPTNLTLRPNGGTSNPFSEPVGSS